MPGLVPGRVEIEMLTQESTNFARSKKWTNISISLTRNTFAIATKFVRTNFALDREIICFTLLDLDLDHVLAWPAHPSRPGHGPGAGIHAADSGGRLAGGCRGRFIERSISAQRKGNLNVC